MTGSLNPLHNHITAKYLPSHFRGNTANEVIDARVLRSNTTDSSSRNLSNPSAYQAVYNNSLSHPFIQTHSYQTLQDTYLPHHEQHYYIQTCICPRESCRLPCIVLTYLTYDTYFPSTYNRYHKTTRCIFSSSI